MTCPRCITVTDGTRYLCQQHRPPPEPVVYASTVAGPWGPDLVAALSADGPPIGTLVAPPLRAGVWEALGQAYLLKRDNVRDP